MRFPDNVSHTLIAPSAPIQSAIALFLHSRGYIKHTSTRQHSRVRREPYRRHTPYMSSQQILLRIIQPIRLWRRNRRRRSIRITSTSISICICSIFPLSAYCSRDRLIVHVSLSFPLSFSLLIPIPVPIPPRTPRMCRTLPPVAGTPVHSRINCQLVRTLRTGEAARTRIRPFGRVRLLDRPACATPFLVVV